MTRTLLSSVAVAGLLAVLAASPAGAQTPDPHAGHAAAAAQAAPAPVAPATPAEAVTPPAFPGMAGMDPGAMAAMHERMAAMTPAEREAMHARMAAMDPAARAAMHAEMMEKDPASMGAMPGGMAAMHERMAAMTPAEREAMHARMAAMDPAPRAAMHAEMMGAAAPCPAMAGMHHSAMRAMTDVALKASSPADGATVHGSPDTIALTLPHAMTLQALTLTDTAGHDVPLALTLSDSPVESVSVPVSGLAPGLYRVAWRAAGTDHTMSGGFSFTVH